MRYFLVLMLGLSATSALAGAMDRSDCRNGPYSYSNDVNGALNSLDKRIVACFNYSQDIEIENHNIQARSITLLVEQINRLEQRIQALENSRN